MAHTQAETRLPLGGRILLSSLADNWWLLLLRGLAALCDGVFALGAALFAKGGDMAPRWWLALVGIVGILAGVVTFLYPGMTALVLLMFIAAWAIIIGLLQIWGAIEWRNVLDDAWLLALNGVLAVAFGAILFARPGAGAVALVWMIGWFAVVFGCLNVALSFRLKTAA